MVFLWSHAFIPPNICVNQSQVPSAIACVHLDYILVVQNTGHVQKCSWTPL